MGVFGLAWPAGLVAFIPHWQSYTGLWVASLVRLVFGVTLWLVAPSSRAPVVLQVLVVPAISLAFARAWSVGAVVMGGFILWSVVA